jgi:hypothetical protein
MRIAEEDLTKMCAPFRRRRGLRRHDAAFPARLGFLTIHEWNNAAIFSTVKPKRGHVPAVQGFAYKIDL